MDDIDDEPNTIMFPPEHEQYDSSAKISIMKGAVSAIVHEYIDLHYGPTPKPKTCLDHTQEYAKEVLSLGLFYMEFQDAIREGDGHRVLRYLLLWFRLTGHNKYAVEAMTLLSQYYYLFTPRLAEQLIWSHFVNTRGGLGA